MDVVDESAKAWMKDHKRKDWKKCYNEGRANGHYNNYKNAMDHLLLSISK